MYALYIRVAVRGAFFRPLQEWGGVYYKIDDPPSFRTRRYFSHHSARGNSLHNYPSFAGETIGTRIDRDNSLIMPPSFVRQLRNNTAQSDGTTVKLGAHILAALRLVFRL